MRITIDKMNNGYTLSWYSDSCVGVTINKLVFEVPEDFDIDKEEAEFEALSRLFYNIMDAVNVVNNKDKKYELKIEVKKRG